LRGCRPGRTVVLLLVLAVCAACSGSVDADKVRTAGGPVVGLTVSGTPGEPPSVRIVAPLKVTETKGQVMVAGTGAPIQVDQLFVLQLALYDARTGAKALSTYDEPLAPIATKSTGDRLFPVLTKELVGLRQGSRLVMVVTGADAFGSGGTPPSGVRADDPVVVVADVVAVPPTETVPAAEGDAQEPPAGRPSVVLEGDEPVRIEVGQAAEPDEVVVVPLIEGTGPPVRAHSLVTLDLLAQAWGSRLPFEDTYFKEPVVLPVGTEGSIPAWDHALVGLNRGSRVLVIAPAEQARVPVSSGVPEHATIAWVIDILGVS